MALECVCCTDFHLDGWRRFFASAELAVRAQIVEIEKPFQYAYDKGIERVFILGDIGEHPTLTEEARYWFLDLLLRWDGKLKIDVILGNHDFAVDSLNNLITFQQLYKSGRFKSIRFFTDIHTEVIDGVQINFMPYPHTKPPKSERVSLNLAHMEISGAARDNGRVVKESEGVSLKRSKDQWVIGHFHTHQAADNWMYVGTLYQKNFGEKLPKGWAHIRCDDLGERLNFRYRFVENQPSVTLHTVEVADVSDYKQVTKNLNQLFKIKLHRGVEMNQTVLSAPNVIDYELIGDAGSFSGLDGSDETANDEVDFTREANLDPTDGLEAVLTDTLESSHEVAIGLEMARIAAQKAFEQLEVL